MSGDDLHYLEATELAKLLHARKVSPVEVTEAMLRRIAALDPRLHAYATVTPELALEQARRAEERIMRRQILGPLHGVPIALKDLCFTRGVPTAAGMPLHRDFRPAFDGTVVTRLREAGAVLLGKTSTPEFGCKGETNSPRTGISRNPWDPSKTPGGSSGGTAAAVAAGMGPLSVGTDGAGSAPVVPVAHSSCCASVPRLNFAHSSRLVFCASCATSAIRFRAGIVTVL